MGIGRGFVIAAAVVHPEKPIISVSGDSAIGFAGMEMETVCRYQLPVKIVVFNNGGMGPGHAKHPDNPLQNLKPNALIYGARYDKMMEAFGGKGWFVENPKDLKSALEAAMAFRGPALAECAATSGALGIRIMMNRGVSEGPADRGINRVLAAGARHGLPVNILCWGRLEQARALAARNPDTAIVIDHLGLQQPFEPPPPAQPFHDLPDVLKLAGHRNVAIKITGACTLSREAYPYKDIWDPLARVFDAFGIDRCLWGTDWTRAVALLTYKQGVDAFRISDRLSDRDKRTLMGGALQRVYRWSPTKA